MDDKLAKLQAATDEAEKEVKTCKEALEEAEKKLEAAKTKYKNLPPDEQAKLQINDTELPELMDLCNRAKDAYETAQSRLATNQKYLTLLKTKLGK